jgi:P27 family predicted phage terminase small subunit
MTTEAAADGVVLHLAARSSSAEEAPAIPVADLGSPPAWLSRQAKTLWRDLIPALEDAFPETVTVLDVHALALMLENLAITHAAAKSMRGRAGWIQAVDVDEAHRDRLRKAPASQVMRDHSRAFLELAREYGLTPKSRRLLDLVPVVADDDDNDDLFDT